MPTRFGKPKVMEVLAGAGVVILLGISIGFAVSYPVKGLPMYGKTVLGAAFLALVYYSIRRERRKKPINQMGREATVQRAIDHEPNVPDTTR